MRCSHAGLPYDLIQGSFDPLATPLWGLKGAPRNPEGGPVPIERSRSYGTRAQLSASLGQVRDDAQECEGTTQTLNPAAAKNKHKHHRGPKDVLLGRGGGAGSGARDGEQADGGGDGVVMCSQGTATTDNSSLDGEWGWLEKTVPLNQMCVDDLMCTLLPAPSFPFLDLGATTRCAHLPAWLELLSETRISEERGRDA